MIDNKPLTIIYGYSTRKSIKQKLIMWTLQPQMLYRIRYMVAERSFTPPRPFLAKEMISARLSVCTLCVHAKHDQFTAVRPPSAL